MRQTQIILLSALLFAFQLSAQNNFTSGGGEIKGEGGNASQSIGQLSYTTISGDGLQVTESKTT